MIYNMYIYIYISTSTSTYTVLHIFMAYDVACFAFGPRGGCGVNIMDRIIIQSELIDTSHSVCSFSWPLSSYASCIHVSIFQNWLSIVLPQRGLGFCNPTRAQVGASHTSCLHMMRFRSLASPKVALKIIYIYKYILVNIYIYIYIFILVLVYM